jgi:hypothetical protein
VQVQGVVETITDADEVYRIGLAIGDVVGGGSAGSDSSLPGDAISEYVANAARKRYAYIVEPRRIISWDHTKLGVPPGQGL